MHFEVYEMEAHRNLLLLLILARGGIVLAEDSRVDQSHELAGLVDLSTRLS